MLVLSANKTFCMCVCIQCRWSCMLTIHVFNTVTFGLTEALLKLTIGRQSLTFSEQITFSIQITYCLRTPTAPEFHSLLKHFSIILTIQKTKDNQVKSLQNSNRNVCNLTRNAYLKKALTNFHWHKFHCQHVSIDIMNFSFDGLIRRC